MWPNLCDPLMCYGYLLLMKKKTAESPSDGQHSRHFEERQFLNCFCFFDPISYVWIYSVQSCLIGFRFWDKAGQVSVLLFCVRKWYNGIGCVWTCIDTLKQNVLIVLVMKGNKLLTQCLFQYNNLHCLFSFIATSVSSW